MQAPAACTGKWWLATPQLCSICSRSTFTACSAASPHDRRKLPALEKVEAAGRLERSNSFCSLASDDGADGEMGRQTPAIAAVSGAPLLGWHVGWVQGVGEAGRGRWRNRHAVAQQACSGTARFNLVHCTQHVMSCHRCCCPLTLTSSHPMLCPTIRPAGGLLLHAGGHQGQ